jgi:hypothetical protein
MLRRITLFKKTVLGLAVLACCSGLNGNCSIPEMIGRNTYWPRYQDAQDVGTPDTYNQSTPEESFTKHTISIPFSQCAYVSSADPGMVSAISDPFHLRAADPDSPHGMCSILAQFDLSGHEKDTITKANLVLCLDSDPANQSSSTLNVIVCQLASPWSPATVSYNNLSGSCEGAAFFSISNNIPNSPVSLDMTRVNTGLTSSGSTTNMVQRWADGSAANYGLLIRPPFDNGSSGQFRTFEKGPHSPDDNNPSLEIEYIRYTEN